MHIVVHCRASEAYELLLCLEQCPSVWVEPRVNVSPQLVDPLGQRHVNIIDELTFELLHDKEVIIKQKEVITDFFVLDGFPHRTLYHVPLRRSDLFVLDGSVRLEAFGLSSDEPDESVREVLLD